LISSETLNAMQTIATLTMNPSVDKSSSVDRVAPELKLRCGQPKYYPGGGGLNVSRAIKNMGGESLAICAAGGFSGQMLRHLLDKEGVSSRFVETRGSTRENLSVFEETTGHMFRFGMPGPQFSEAEWRACLEVLGSLTPAPDYLVASGSLPPGVPVEFYARVADVARELGSKMILDTSGDALRQGVSGGVFLLKVNFKELEQTRQGPLEREADIKRAALDLLNKNRAEAVAVSLGAAGALIATSGGTFERVRSPTVPIRSKIGAGDSMVAGMALGLARGMSFSQATRHGVAAGAAAVMMPGSELCRGEDVEQLFREILAEERSHDATAPTASA
jgi:6-phosphofructokinase 2